MPLGFLAVSSEPGDKVSLDEFHDWYNNEHVPIRLNHLPSFLSGARFEAIDGQSPSWLALYDIDDTSTFEHDSYTRLRAHRSQRESDLIKRLELLDRRTYKLFSDSGESIQTSSLKCTNPTPYIFTHGLQLESGETGDRDVEEWLMGTGNSHNTQGWVRTRVFKCIDNLKTGSKVDEGVENQDVPRYFVIHEMLEKPAGPLVAGFSSQSSQGMRIVEERAWHLYKAYPCIAQGNVSSA